MERSNGRHRNKYSKAEAENHNRGKLEGNGHQEKQQQSAKNEADGPFDRLSSIVVKAAIKKANPHNAMGPSGLRFSHLEEARNDGLARNTIHHTSSIIELPRLVYST